MLVTFVYEQGARLLFRAFTPRGMGLTAALKAALPVCTTADPVFSTVSLWQHSPARGLGGVDVRGNVLGATSLRRTHQRDCLKLQTEPISATTIDFLSGLLPDAATKSGPTPRFLKRGQQGLSSDSVKRQKNQVLLGVEPRY